MTIKSRWIGGSPEERQAWHLEQAALGAFMDKFPELERIGGDSPLEIARNRYVPTKAFLEDPEIRSACDKTRKAADECWKRGEEPTREALAAVWAAEKELDRLVLQKSVDRS